MPDERAARVPYVRIELAQADEAGAAFTRLAAAMNAQLELDCGLEIPFVLPRGSVGKTMMDAACKRMVLYGTGGCGKTRCLLEVLKARPLLRRVYVINPKGLAEDAVNRTRLSGILEECREDGHDAIVWDNFPEGLERQSVGSVKLAARMLGSCGKSAYVALSSRQQLEKAVHDAILTARPGLKALRLEYGPKDIDRFLSRLGSGIQGVKQVFGESIEPVLDEVSSILWRLEPTPRAVLDYLGKAYVERCATPQDALALARGFFGRSANYEHRFAALKGARRRRRDLEFLYALKLCYELGMDRKMESIAKLQKRVFGTEPGPEILSPEFQFGLYRDGGQISIHDMAKDSILIEEEIARKMISYLAGDHNDDNNYDDDDGRQSHGAARNGNNAYLLGTFVGKNGNLANKGDLIRLLPGRKMKGLRGDRFYQIGLGHGIGKAIIDGLDARMRRRVFESARTNNQFSKNMGEGIGWEMAAGGSNNSDNRIIFNYAKGNLAFSRGLGIGIGMSLPRLPSKVRKDAFIQAERNIQFADGLGIGTGSVIEFMSPDEHLWVFRTAEYNSEFARGVGTGLGQNFVALAQSIQSYALALLPQNPQFANGFGIGIGDIFEYLHGDLQKMTAETAEKNSEFARGLGIGMGYSFSYFSSRLQRRTMQIAAQNPSFAQGAGLGIGFTYYYLGQDARDNMLERARADARFALGLGEGYGRSYGALPARLQKQVFSIVEEDPNVSSGFGMGTGYGFGYLAGRERKEFARLALENKEFARGLGHGLGRAFVFHDESLCKAILARMVLEKELAFGMGGGLGAGFFYLDDKAREKFFEMAGANAEFAEGLGAGLATVFSYFPEGLQEKVAEHVQGNTPLMTGMKTGFEQVWQYLDDGQRKFAGDFCR